MTEVNPCGWLQNAGSTHTAEQLRSYMGSLLALPGSAGSLRSASGVHPGLGGQLAVTQNGTPNMSVNVASGAVFIQGTEGSKQGTYFCQNDATVNKVIATSDPTNPRIDIVVAKVQDAFYSGVTNAWSLAVVTGTPAGSPSAPAAPVDSIIIAQIAVAANAASIVTANITDKRVYNAALGGSILATSALRPANPYKGIFAYELDTNRPIYYDGANWRHNLGSMICTSSTRPASPFTGMRIFETDTLFWYTWNGTKWLRDPQEILVSTSDSWTSTTTLRPVTAGDTTPNGGLSFAMEANSKYTFTLMYGIQATGTSGLGFDVTFPAGAQVDLGYIGPNTAGGVVDAWLQSWASGAAPVVLGFNGSSFVTVKGTVQCGATPGNFVFNFAQGTSNASASFLLVGSSLNYRQVA